MTFFKIKFFHRPFIGVGVDSQEFVLKMLKVIYFRASIVVSVNLLGSKKMRQAVMEPNC